MNYGYLFWPRSSIVLFAVAFSDVSFHASLIAPASPPPPAVPEGERRKVSAAADTSSAHQYSIV